LSTCKKKKSTKENKDPKEEATIGRKEGKKEKRQR
jgi:hypothetical protein